MMNPNVLNEMRVLGGLMEMPETFYLLDWDVDFFDDTLNRLVMEFIVGEVEHDRPIDRISIAGLAENTRNRDLVQRVYDCWNEKAFTVHDLRFWHRQLKQAWAERVIRLTGRDLDANPEKYQQAVEVLQGLTVDNVADVPESVVDYRPKYLRELKERKQVVPTGSVVMDKMLGGGWVTGVFGVAGRPKQGKSMVLLWLARQLAESGRKVLFVSLEMTQLQCMNRLLAQVAGIDSNLIAKDALDFEVERNNEFVWARDLIANVELPAGLVIENPVDRTVFDLQTLILRTKNVLGGLDAVFLDYAQILEYPNKFQPVAGHVWISNQLQRLSVRLDLPIVTGLQLRRADTADDKKLPGMKDIAESDQYGRDATAVFYITRHRKPEDKEWAAGSELILHLGTSRYVENGVERFDVEDKFSRMKHVPWR